MAAVTARMRSRLYVATVDQGREGFHQVLDFLALLEDRLDATLDLHQLRLGQVAFAIHRDGSVGLFYRFELGISGGE